MAISDPVRAKAYPQPFNRPAPATGKRVLEEYRAQQQGRVQLRAGKQYLHWSGGFLTDDPNHAWVGTIDQARSCRKAFDAAAGCRAIPVNSIIPTPLNEEA